MANVSLKSPDHGTLRPKWLEDVVDHPSLSLADRVPPDKPALVPLAAVPTSGALVHLPLCGSRLTARIPGPKKKGGLLLATQNGPALPSSLPESASALTDQLWPQGRRG